MKIRCWKCQKIIGESPMTIPFRATCPFCDVDLHVCHHCHYYAPGKPNDCLVPGTDPIQDRQKSNLCEEFKVKIDPKENTQSTQSYKVFGEAPPKPKSFNDLFKDGP